MGHAPNSAERRRHGELGGVGKHIGSLSAGIKVSQPMGTNGLQPRCGRFHGYTEPLDSFVSFVFLFSSILISSSAKIMLISFEWPRTWAWKGSVCRVTYFPTSTFD